MGTERCSERRGEHGLLRVGMSAAAWRHPWSRALKAGAAAQGGKEPGTSRRLKSRWPPGRESESERVEGRLGERRGGVSSHTGISGRRKALVLSYGQWKPLELLTLGKMV